VREVRPERDGRSVVEASRVRWQQHTCATAATTCDGGEKLMAGTVDDGAEWRRGRVARPYLVVLASLEGNRNCFLRRRFHAHTNLDVGSSYVFVTISEGILVIESRNTARGIGLCGCRRRRPPQERRTLILPPPASGMKSFPVNRGHSVSCALFSDVSNSRYGHASASPCLLSLPLHISATICQPSSCFH
jgi:hypothetical protein